MSIETNPKKNVEVHKEIHDLKKQAYRKAILKSLLALSALVAGVAAIIFLNINFLPYGIGIIVMSAAAMYEYFTHHRHTAKVYTRAAKAIERAP
ncbi:MAG: hypothetical protein WCF19_06550 [Chlamydiales bacterium]